MKNEKIRNRTSIFLIRASIPAAVLLAATPAWAAPGLPSPGTTDSISAQKYIASRGGVGPDLRAAIAAQAAQAKDTAAVKSDSVAVEKPKVHLTPGLQRLAYPAQYQVAAAASAAQPVQPVAETPQAVAPVDAPVASNDETEEPTDLSLAKLKEEGAIVAFSIQVNSVGLDRAQQVTLGGYVFAACADKLKIDNTAVANQNGKRTRGFRLTATPVGGKSFLACSKELADKAGKNRYSKGPLRLVGLSEIGNTTLDLSREDSADIGWFTHAEFDDAFNKEKIESITNAAGESAHHTGLAEIREQERQDRIERARATIADCEKNPRSLDGLDQWEQAISDLQREGAISDRDADLHLRDIETRRMNVNEADLAERIEKARPGSLADLEDEIFSIANDNPSDIRAQMAVSLCEKVAEKYVALADVALEDLAPADQNSPFGARRMNYSSRNAKVKSAKNGYDAARKTLDRCAKIPGLSDEQRDELKGNIAAAQGEIQDGWMHEICKLDISSGVYSGGSMTGPMAGRRGPSGECAASLQAQQKDAYQQIQKANKKMQRACYSRRPDMDTCYDAQSAVSEQQDRIRKLAQVPAEASQQLQQAQLETTRLMQLTQQNQMGSAGVNPQFGNAQQGSQAPLNNQAVLNTLPGGPQNQFGNFAPNNNPYAQPLGGQGQMPQAGGNMFGNPIPFGTINPSLNPSLNPSVNPYAGQANANASFNARMP